MRDPAEVISKMGPWLENRGSAAGVRRRSAKQRSWDSAVFACAEFVRRLTGDEDLAGAIHLLLTPTPELEKIRTAGATGK